MRTIFALFTLALLACGLEKDDTGETPEADADADSDTDADTDADADADADSDADTDADSDADCPEDTTPGADWPEVVDDAEAYFYSNGNFSGLGDVNGDGYDDVVLGADRVTLGPLCDLEDDWGAEAVLSVERTDGPYLTVGAGDVDGDGLDDLLVGDYRTADGGTEGQEGEMFIAISPMAGEVYLPDLAAARIVGDMRCGWFGFALAGVGDVDGDGTPDALAGAFGYDDGAGAALLFSGDTRGYHSASEVGIAIRGSGEFLNVGAEVHAAGDTDGDGLADLLVGTDVYPAAVGIFRGPILADMAFADADAMFLPDPDGNEYGDHFGMSFSGLGDQDGDGLPEIGVGANETDTSLGGDGAVFVFSGSTEGTQIADEAFAIIEAAHDQGVGTDVADAGDVDCDGHGDLLIGTMGRDSTAEDASVIYILFGPVDAGTANVEEAAIAIGGTVKNAQVGAAAEGAGDTNGDGFDDVLVYGWADVGGGMQSPVTLLLGRP